MSEPAPPPPPRDGIRLAVTTKKQAVERAQPNRLEKLAAIVAMIELRLKDYDGSSSISVENTFDWVYINEVVAMYENAGWTVRRTDTQRDGSWLTFS